MSGMNPGFAAYLAAKKAGKTPPAKSPSTPKPSMPAMSPNATGYGKCHNCGKNVAAMAHSC